jgi:hypothetical protein
VVVIVETKRNKGRWNAPDLKTEFVRKKKLRVVINMMYYSSRQSEIGLPGGQPHPPEVAPSSGRPQERRKTSSITG